MTACWATTSSFSNVVQLAGHVEVGDWAIFSGYPGAHQFCRIGAHAFIGNNTSVIRDIPPYVFALVGLQNFRIGETADRSARIKDDGGSDHRTGHAGPRPASSMPAILRGLSVTKDPRRAAFTMRSRAECSGWRPRRAGSGVPLQFGMNFGERRHQLAAAVDIVELRQQRSSRDFGRDLFLGRFPAPRAARPAGSAAKSTAPS